VSSQTNKSPLPDPKTTTVGKKLLACKNMLVGVNRQLQHYREPKKVLRKDLMTHIKDLTVVIGEMEKLMKQPRNKPIIEQCLKSSIAVKEQVSEARRLLGSGLIPVDNIHSTTTSVARQIESGVELDKVLGKCSAALRGAISQFRI